MSDLLNQLGINWRLLLAQGVNFLILFFALVFLVYRPLSRVIEKRRRTIESGLESAEESEKKLKEVGGMVSKKIAEADESAMELIKKAEGQAKDRSSTIIIEAEGKARRIAEEAANVAEQKRRSELENLSREAKSIIKIAIAKAVNESPNQIDDKLVAQAAKIISETK